MLPILTKGLAPRARDEAHRTATALELMFDLAAVIAIAAAALGLHHAISAGHIAEGLIGFIVSFWMIWLAWLNYTWFASAYDDGSAGFRGLSMVIMFGALMLAAGIPTVFTQEPIWLAVCGFIVMRIGMAAFWLLAARGDPARRRTALSYAGGILVMQAYWIALVTFVPPGSTLYLPGFLLGVIGELAVPALSERQGATSWHRHHIIERYGLMNIIVLGECFLAITATLGLHETGGVIDRAALGLALTSTLITFALWALYFTDDRHLIREELRHALLWGYGHFVLFAAGAATGAGFAVNMDLLTHHAHTTPQIAALSVTIPVAVYLATLWLTRDRLVIEGAGRWLLLGAAIAIPLIGLALPQPLLLTALVLLGTAGLRRFTVNG